MPIVLDIKLYNRIKRKADTVYDKPSAYKSMYIQRQYKLNGGDYADDGKPRNLDRWKKEDWRDIGGKEYPVYRPHKRVDDNTPLTVDEIDPKNAKEQIALKQIIKGSANLPEFKSKGSGLYHITDYTKQQAKRLGVQVFPSDNPKKKIEVYDKNGLFITYAGGAGYKDFPTYTAENGKEYADKRRALYKQRHEKDRHKVGSAGYYADQLLW